MPLFPAYQVISSLTSLRELRLQPALLNTPQALEEHSLLALPHVRRLGVRCEPLTHWTAPPCSQPTKGLHLIIIPKHRCCPRTSTPPCPCPSPLTIRRLSRRPHFLPPSVHRAPRLCRRPAEPLCRDLCALTRRRAPAALVDLELSKCVWSAEAGACVAALTALTRLRLERLECVRPARASASASRAAMSVDLTPLVALRGMRCFELTGATGSVAGVVQVGARLAGGRCPALTRTRAHVCACVNGCDQVKSVSVCVCVRV
jgi:hypothetical protein